MSGRSILALKALIVVFGLLISAPLASSQAHAQGCTASAGSLNFGTVDLSGNVASQSSSSISISCSGTPNKTVRVCINLGAGSSGASDSTLANRYLSNGVANLNYSLYGQTDLQHAWGSVLQTGSAQVSYDVALSAQGTGTATLSVVGILFANQASTVGGATSFTYSSTIAGADTFLASIYLPTLGATCNEVGQQNRSPITFSVSVSAPNVCSLATTPLDFGSVDLTTTSTVTGSITISCPTNLPYTIALNGGLAAASNPARRRMTSGANAISYGLYQDAAFSKPWGDGAASGGTLFNGIGLGGIDVPIYGRIAPQAGQPVGTYADVVVVTVSY